MLLAILQWMGSVWAGFYAASKAIQTYRHVLKSGYVTALLVLPQGSGNCDFCKHITQAKKQHEEQQRQNRTVFEQFQMMNLFFESQTLVHFVQMPGADLLSIDNPSWNIRAESPPAPPPRKA